MARAKKKPVRKAKTAAKSRARAKSGSAAKKKAAAKKPAPRKRLGETYDFVITVANGQVGFDASSDEGNGYAPEKSTDRDRFRWSIADPAYEFRLVFRRLRCKGLGSGAKNRGVFKYDVQVRHVVTKVPLDPLDPVIIIGRV
jgi:hypothetical protein